MADDDQATFQERFTGQPDPQAKREGGLLQTIPQAVETLGTAEGRSKFISTIEGYPRHFAEGLLDFFKTPGEAVQKGLTPDQEVEFGVNAALGTIGAEFKMPKATASAFNQFHEQVVKPVAQNLISVPNPDPARIIVPLNPANVRDTFPPPSVARSNLALTGEPHIDAIINSPATKQVIDNPTVDRTHDVPYTAGGSVPLSDPKMFIDKHFPHAFEIDGRVFDPAEPFAVHENIEQHVMDILTKAGMDDATAYKVAHFEFAEKAEGAWYRAHGIDQAKAEAAYAPYMAEIQRNGGNDFPPNLYKRPYPHDQPSAAHNEAIAEPRPTPSEIDRAKQIIADWQAKGSPAPEPEKPPIVNPLQEAHELGVIGDGERLPLTGDPAKAARSAMAATAKPGDKITQEVGPSAWRQRFDRTLDKMQTPADARRVIEAIVDRNDEFQAARQGDLSPAQIEQLGVVAGLDTTKIDVPGTSAKVKTNSEMRNTIEAFVSLNGKIKEAADAVRAKNGLADDAEVAEMKRLELQRDLLLDATTSTKEFVALRAEFGRLGNVIQEFMAASKDANAMRGVLRDKLGETIAGVRDRAKIIADTDDRALGRVLNPNNRAKMPWYFWTWQNLLISGLITHTKYAIVNTAQTALDRVFAPEVAAIIGRVRGERTSLAAPIWSFASMIHSFPDAVRGSWEAFKTGERVPAIEEMELAARGKESPMGTPTPYQTDNRPDWGIWKRVFNEDQLAKAAKVIGMPGKSANAMHTFYRILNTKGSAGFRAYEAAFAERPATNAEFWQRYDYHYAHPTDENLSGSIADGYDGTFMGEMGSGTAQLAGALKRNPMTRWLFPFMHIPIEIARKAVSYSPLAAFGPEMRAQLMGERGAPAQNLALAKVVVGTAGMAYFVSKALNGELTGSYPIDQKERARWRDMGMQPNSIAVGGQWHSVERLGPPGILIGLAADLGHIWQHYDVNDENAMAKAIAALGVAMANSIASDVGFQSIRNIVDVLEGQQKPERFLSYEASTLLIPSLVRQAASFGDPYIREADNFISGLKYSLPFAREGLRPKRDPIYGEPLANPGYGTFGRNVGVQQDFAKHELDRLRYYPTAPQKHIGGVQLTPEQYDKYEATAGPLVKAALDGLVRSPQWQGHNGNDEWQTAVAKSVIAAARRKAAGAMQLDDTSLIEAARQRRLTQINGKQ